MTDCPNDDYLEERPRQKSTLVRRWLPEHFTYKLCELLVSYRWGF